MDDKEKEDIEIAKMAKALDTLNVCLDAVARFGLEVEVSVLYDYDSPMVRVKVKRTIWSDHL